MIRRLLFVFIIALTPAAYAQYNCDEFTVEQDIALRMAYAIGTEEHDWGYTLAGIVWRESFVDKYIVRATPTDGDHGSYGISHVLLTTAMERLDYISSWRAKAELIPLFINNDQFSLRFSLDYLVSHEERGWRRMIARYNGGGSAAKDYSVDVVERIDTLMDCDYFRHN